MARTPKKPAEGASTPPLTLEQFAALEAWIEAHAKMIAAEKSAGPHRASLVTDAYGKRARAMHLLTGAKLPPNVTLEGDQPASAPDGEDPYDIG